MPGKSLTPAEMREIQRLAGEGENRRAIATAVGRHVDTVSDYLTRIHLDPKRSRIRVEDLPGPVPKGDLCDNALRGLEDFEFFRRHYLGHISRPWAVEAAIEIRALLISPDREYVVLNAPSGCGKSTFKHDLAAWLTCHTRSIRGLFGGDVMTNAVRDLKRLRRTLERTSPPKASDFDLIHGTGVDALGCLSIDFGRFKPLHQETWRDDSVVVEQFGEDLIIEKEPTWSAYGRDSGVLSNRFNVIFWDDLVTKKNTKTIEARESLRHDWDTDFESRLEPAGMHVLMGQRLAADDLYRYCLDKTTDDLDEDEEGNEVVIARRPKYRHICYKAHDVSRCLQGAKGSHLRTAHAWPVGCLLEPVRLPWKDLRGHMDNPKVFGLMYQQEDMEAEDALVALSWIEGTEDDDGIHPGCLDPERRLRELPRGIRGPLISVGTIDPSASRWWGIEWWIYAPASGLRILFDIFNERMGADQLLDWDNDAQEHRGLMQEWQDASHALGVPITHWIVEENACQKWLFQFAHFRSWMARNPGVSVLPHSTGHRKLDKGLGVPSLGPLYRTGMKRLPWHRSAQPLVGRFVTQLTRWSEEIARGNGRQLEDLVMSDWFLEVKLPQIAPEVRHMEPVYLHRPSWMTGRTGRPHEDAWATTESPYEAELRARRGA